MEATRIEPAHGVPGRARGCTSGALTESADLGGRIAKLGTPWLDGVFGGADGACNRRLTRAAALRCRPMPSTSIVSAKVATTAIEITWNPDRPNGPGRSSALPGLTTFICSRNHVNAI